MKTKQLGPLALTFIVVDATGRETECVTQGEAELLASILRGTFFADWR